MLGMNAINGAGPRDWVPPEPPAESVHAYLSALRRRWLFVATIVAVTTVAALLFSALAGKQYESTAKVLIGQDAAVKQFLGAPGTSSADAGERELNTQVQLIRLDPVAGRVRARLGLQTSNERLLEKLTDELDTRSNILSITVRDSNADMAARIANAFADEYRVFQGKAARAGLGAAAATARRRLSRLGPAARETRLGRELSARIRELEIVSAFQSGDVQVVDRADPAESPVSPRPQLSALIGLVVGLFLAGGLVLVLEHSDRRLHDEEEVGDALGVPVLASIPRRSPGRFPKESYNMLATRLLLSRDGPSPSALMITSPGPGEGKTQLTLGLAGALSALGRRVIAIETNLRRPQFSTQLGLPEGGGLASILAGSSTLNEELVEVLAASDSQPTTTGQVSYAVLPAGSHLPDLHARILQPAMAILIEEARVRADVVLIDAAPVLTGADALALARVVEAALIVLRLHRTTKGAAMRAVQLLESVGASPVGAVVTNAGAGAFPYSTPPSRRAGRPEDPDELVSEPSPQGVSR